MGNAWLASSASEPFLYLTTVGRRTGRAHRIEIWFAARDGRLYLLAGDRERADWVRNLQANARVTVELRDESQLAGELIFSSTRLEETRHADVNDLVAQCLVRPRIDRSPTETAPVKVAERARLIPVESRRQHTDVCTTLQ